MVKKKIEGQSYVPAVIEPSFGIGRIIYAILEHSYWVRENQKTTESKENKEDLERNVLSLSYTICPFKTVVLPLSSDSSYDGIITEISNSLGFNGISYRVDDSGVGVGRKYARSDEIGIPFAITIDMKSPIDKTVTLRERDSCKQIRIPISEVVVKLRDLVDKKVTWDNIMKSYPEQIQTATEKVGKK